MDLKILLFAVLVLSFDVNGETESNNEERDVDQEETEDVETQKAEAEGRNYFNQGLNTFPVNYNRFLRPVGPAANAPTKSISGAVKSNCLYWCPTPKGELYCCKKKLPARPKVGLACPRMARFCPQITGRNNYKLNKCAYDQECKSSEKCCYDGCLGIHVCKLGNKHPFFAGFK